MTATAMRKDAVGTLKMGGSWFISNLGSYERFELWKTLDYESYLYLCHWIGKNRVDTMVVLDEKPYHTKQETTQKMLCTSVEYINQDCRY